MADIYIRTPDNNESRGPFDATKLQTLAEAGQVNPNTLFYDEDKEEWIPIALNEELNAAVFPQREKLSLKLGTPKTEQKDTKETSEEDPNDDGSKLTIEDMLNAAEGNTEERLELKQQQKSLERAAGLAAPILGIMMLASAITLIVPHLPQIKSIINSQSYATIVNHPVLMLGFLDAILAILLFLAVTEVYPIIRGRAMIALGCGVYVGWAIGDPLLMALSVAAGLGIFIASISLSYRLTLVAAALGFGGNGYLTYLAINGRFTEFFSGLQFNFIAG